MKNILFCSLIFLLIFRFPNSETSINLNTHSWKIYYNDSTVYSTDIGGYKAYTIKLDTAKIKLTDTLKINYVMDIGCDFSELLVVKGEKNKILKQQKTIDFGLRTASIGLNEIKNFYKMDGLSTFNIYYGIECMTPKVKDLKPDDCLLLLIINFVS